MRNDSSLLEEIGKSVEKGHYKTTEELITKAIRQHIPALEILEKYRLVGKTAVYFSPVFGRIQPVEIVDFLMEKKLNDVKLQIQLHKVIWDPQKRGV